MIEVAKSAEELAGPAATPEDLHDRLSRCIGQIIRIENPAAAAKWDGIGVFAGRLEQLLVISRALRELRLKFVGDSPSEDKASGFLPVSLNSAISVLIDGQWKVLHEPRNAELQPVPKPELTRVSVFRVDQDTIFSELESFLSYDAEIHLVQPAVDGDLKANAFHPSWKGAILIRAGSSVIREDYAGGTQGTVFAVSSPALITQLKAATTAKAEIVLVDSKFAQGTPYRGLTGKGSQL